MEEAVKFILDIILLLTAWPVGLVMAKLCDDELIPYKNYIRYMVYFLVIVDILIFFFYFKVSLIFSISYLIFVFLVMLFEGRKLEKR
jgi:hypothetical protein